MKSWATLILISIFWRIEVAAQSSLTQNAGNVFDHYIVIHNPSGIAYQGLQGLVGVQWLHAGLDGDNLRNSIAYFIYPLGENEALGLRAVHFNSNILQQGTFSMLLGHRFFDERLSLGFNANVLYLAYDRDKFEGFDFDDPVIANGTAKNALSFGAGFLLRLSDVLACGFSIDDVNEPNIALGEAKFKKEAMYKLGAVYLHPSLSPQLDLQMDGREVSFQAGAHRSFLDKKIDLFAGYHVAGSEGRALLFAIGFMPGAWGVSYNIRHELSELGQASSGSHFLTLHFTKPGSSKLLGTPTITVDNPNSTTVKTEPLIISGEARSEAGITRIEYLKNGKIVHAQGVDPALQKVPFWLSLGLEEGNNEIVVVAHAGERRSSKKIHARFAPVILPPKITFHSSIVIELDTTWYHLHVSIDDPRGLQSVRVLVNGEERKRITFDDTAFSYELSDSLDLLEGRNSIEVIAANDKREGRGIADSIFCRSRGVVLAPPQIIIRAPEKLKSLRMATPHGVLRLEWEIKNLDDLADVTLKSGSNIITLTENEVLAKSRNSFVFRKDLSLNEGKNNFEIIAHGTRHTISTHMEVFYNPLLAKKIYRRTWAILVGVNNYRDREIMPLQYAVHDAKGVERLLKERFQFDHIISRYEEEATKKNIVAALFDSLKSAHEEDGVFIFIATHGGTEKTGEGELGYLVPYDGKWKSYNDNITESEIRDAARLTKAKHLFFAIDACYSGLLLIKRGHSGGASAGVNFNAIDTLVTTRARNVLAAGGPNEQVLDGGLENHSIFTGRFLEGLRGVADENGDSYITAREIGKFVTVKVSQDAVLRNTRQNPHYGDLTADDGQFLFIQKRE